MTSLSPVVAPAEEKNKFLAEARSNRDATADNFKNVNNVTSHLYKKEFRKEKKDEENCLNHTPPLCNYNSSALSPRLPPDVRVYPREHMSTCLGSFFSFLFSVKQTVLRDGRISMKFMGNVIIINCVE